MSNKDDLHDLMQKYADFNKRLRDLNAKLRDNGVEQRQVVDEVERILKVVEASTEEEEQAALLHEAYGLLEQANQLREANSQLEQDYENTTAEIEALKGRIDKGLAHLHTAAIETERLLFEIGKLVATLSIGTIVAISAVTPALLPNLGNLAELWPVFGWLFTAIVVSILLCMYTLSNISQLLARLRAKESWRLPDWARKLIAPVPYVLLLTFSVGALLVGIGGFVLFVSRNMS